MTTYFDLAAAQLTKIETLARGALNDFELVEQLDAWERELVRDVTICAAIPGMPARHAAVIHYVVLAYGVSTLPVNAPPADFDTFREHVERLRRLVGQLHSVFHDLANELDALRVGPIGPWGIAFSDSPLSPLRTLEAQGEAAREKLVTRRSFLVHYVPAGLEGRERITTEADKPQRVEATRPELAAQQIARTWTRGQRHRLRVFALHADGDWELDAWRDYDARLDEDGLADVRHLGQGQAAVPSERAKRPKKGRT
jgi:hypothetical protein